MGGAALSIYFSNLRNALFLSAFFWIVLFISMAKDMRRFRNCVLLFLACLFTLPVFVAAGGRYGRNVAMAMLWTAVAVLLFVPFFFIGNGVVMIRKEGHSLANMLSLFLGIVILLGESASILILGAELFGWKTGFGHFELVMLVFALSVIYGCILFLAFMWYTMFIQVIPRKKDFDFVIIHGCGLLEGNQISTLLRQRLDKAIEVYRKDPTPPMMIPSGGKGEDESLSESAAMAEYLVENGVRIEDVLLEPLSMNTMENLKNCKAIIDSREGRKYTALVTSNYHVYRCLSYCRKIGLKCTGIGSRVAGYYWPSALIREFIAIMREPRHMRLAFLGWLGMVLPVLFIWWFAR